MKWLITVWATYVNSRIGIGFKSRDRHGHGWRRILKDIEKNRSEKKVTQAEIDLVLSPGCWKQIQVRPFEDPYKFLDAQRAKTEIYKRTSANSTANSRSELCVVKNKEICKHHKSGKDFLDRIGWCCQQYGRHMEVATVQKPVQYQY